MLPTVELETFINEQMQTHQVPGLALGVIHQHQLVYAHGFGVTSIEAENALPITADTLFRVGSVTKPLTGTMLMRLVQLGRLHLDTPITEYAPTLKFRESGIAERITLRMLLSHTSGLPSDLEYIDRRTTRAYPTDLAQFVAERIPTYRLIAPPGKVYFYSNPGINLAAYLPEVVTGKPYRELMREYVFDPLNMTRTTFSLAEALTYPLVQGHILNTDGQPQVKRPFIDQPMEYPCGFAMTTAHDLARFVQAHLMDESLRVMHTTQVDRLNGEGYGLTFRTRTYNGVPLVGHNGAIGKFGAVLVMSVEQGSGLVLMFNRAPGFWGNAAAITNRVLDAILTFPGTPKADMPLHVPTHNLIGCYLGYSTGLVEITADGVKINGKAADKAVIGRVDDEFIMVDGLPCQRCDDTPITLSADELARYVGGYEADIDTWRVRTDSTRLHIYSDDDREEVTCLALNPQRFVCDWGVIDFELQSDHPSALVNALGYRFQRIS